MSSVKCLWRQQAFPRSTTATSASHRLARSSGTPSSGGGGGKVAGSSMTSNVGDCTGTGGGASGADGAPPSVAGGCARFAASCKRLARGFGRATRSVVVVHACKDPRSTPTNPAKDSLASANARSSLHASFSSDRGPQLINLRPGAFLSRKPRTAKAFDGSKRTVHALNKVGSAKPMMLSDVGVFAVQASAVAAARANTRSVCGSRPSPLTAKTAVSRPSAPSRAHRHWARSKASGT